MTKTERERLQELACDICHQPYACANEDELAKACENCPISAEMCEMETEEQNWISVTERLPENDQDVLVMVHWRDYPEDMMCYGRKYKTRWYLWNGELGELFKGFDITHWMPLPQPPKEE